MKTIILAGGQGSRLGEISQVIPKPMVRIGTHPILWHIMKHYAFFGHKDFIICLGYLGDLIKDYFTNYYLRSRDYTLEFNKDNFYAPRILYHGEKLNLTSHTECMDWTISLIDTGLKTETGGRLHQIIPSSNLLPTNDPIMVTYADAVSNVNLGKLIEFHKKQGKLGTITAVRPPARFGEISISEQGLVKSFKEKPQVSGNGFINAGFGIFEPAAFDLIDSTTSFEKGLLEPLTERGELSVFQHDGFWQCVDTVRELELLNKLWDSDNAPWKLW